MKTSILSSSFSAISKALPTILSSSVLAASIVSVSSPDALARPENRGNPNNNNSGDTTSSVACSDSTVTAAGATYLACEGPFDGNDVGNGDPLLTKLNNGLFDGFLARDYAWEMDAKYDVDTQRIDDGDNKYGFDLNFNDSERNSGSWSVLKTLKEPFAISLKTSTKHSVYLFDGSNTPNGVDSGFWETLGVALNGSGKAGKGLSHATLFVAKNYTYPEDEPRDIPEPATMASLFFAAGGVLVSRRRRHY